MEKMFLYKVSVVKSGNEAVAFKQHVPSADLYHLTVLASTLIGAIEMALKADIPISNPVVVRANLVRTVDIVS